MIVYKYNYSNQIYVQKEDLKNMGVIFSNNECRIKIKPQLPYKNHHRYLHSKKVDYFITGNFFKAVF